MINRPIISIILIDSFQVQIRPIAKSMLIKRPRILINLLLWFCCCLWTGDLVKIRGALDELVHVSMLAFTRSKNRHSLLLLSVAIIVDNVGVYIFS